MLLSSWTNPLADRVDCCISCSQTHNHKQLHCSAWGNLRCASVIAILIYLFYQMQYTCYYSWQVNLK